MTVTLLWSTQSAACFSCVWSQGASVHDFLVTSQAWLCHVALYYFVIWKKTNNIWNYLGNSTTSPSESNLSVSSCFWGSKEHPKIQSQSQISASCETCCLMFCLSCRAAPHFFFQAKNTKNWHPVKMIMLISLLTYYNRVTNICLCSSNSYIQERL